MFMLPHARVDHRRTAHNVNFYVARTFNLVAKLCALNFHIQHTTEIFTNVDVALCEHKNRRKSMLCAINHRLVSILAPRLCTELRPFVT